MQYRKFGNTNIKLSAIGFGCMRLPPDNSLTIPMIHRAVEHGINYFETSATYCQNRSEIQVGLGLKSLRDDVYISTKSHINKKGQTSFAGMVERDSTGEDVKNILKESLHKLGTDRVDFYQFHGFTYENLPIAMAEDGPLDILKDAKDHGLVDHIGFTSHDTTENLIKILDTSEFESMTVYHNILQIGGHLLHENVLPAIEHARKMGIGVIIMGPLGGGILGIPIEELRKIIPGTSSQVELAFRYLLSNPGITTPISGMTRMSDVEENTKIASEYKPLSVSEMSQVEKFVEQYSSLMEKFCTGCGYCQPCPQGVRIPDIFKLMNISNMYGVKKWATAQYARMLAGGSFGRGGANLCIQCGLCEKKCPQNISIREDLKKAHALLTSA
jgi:predicted aldo/keto reductase-like oxidoreductase